MMTQIKTSLAGIKKNSTTMKEFMLLFRHAEMPSNYQPSAEEIQSSIQSWQKWIGDIAQKGKFSSTQQLQPTGKTVRQNAIVDGPFVEIKEIVGGFIICKADTLEEAIEFAQSCPIIAIGGSVEVRPIMDLEI